jgi:hypothetical protein
MAKFKPPRSGAKKQAAVAETPTAKSMVRAIPCLVITVIGIVLLSYFFYTLLSSGLRSGGAK